MARTARVSGSGFVYHVLHRGKEDSEIFFSDEDKKIYLEILAECAARYKMEVLAYCLMPNHIHLVARGQKPDSLSNAIGRTHTRYSRWLNKKYGWEGSLWGNRFHSSVLDKPSIASAIRFVETNPVRSGLVKKAQQWPWSSAKAHVTGKGDPVLASAKNDVEKVEDWAAWPKDGIEDPAYELIYRNTLTGRPTGSPKFVEKLEAKLGRVLKPQKRGRKPRQ